MGLIDIKKNIEFHQDEIRELEKLICAIITSNRTILVSGLQKKTISFILLLPQSALILFFNLYSD